MRLGDLFARDGSGRPRMTWRELGVYVRQLPPSARTRLALGNEDGVWGLQEHLTALAIDELRVANWQRANEGAPKSKQSKPPKPLPRPGVGRARNRPGAESDRLAARARALARLQERRRALAAGEIT